MNKKGILLVIVAPSGCGKGTIISSLLEKRDDLFLSISATTRQPRTGEQDGVHYYYKTKEEFEVLISQNEMLEHALYCENYYGTPKPPILDHLNNGESVILEIEMQGAKQVKELFPECKLLFIAPPDIDTLRRRLRKRGTEDADIIEKRVAVAVQEMKFAEHCDYVVINDILETAVDEIMQIINDNIISTNI